LNPRTLTNDRRRRQLVLPVLVGFCTLLPMLVLAGAWWESEAPRDGKLEQIWSRQGTRPGEFQKPRAMAISADGEIYVVDKSARIQVFDRDGNYLRGWQTPEYANGKPTGLSFDLQGNLLVADTHYFRILRYHPDGTLLTQQTLGGTFGQAPGEFGLVTDAVTDSQGNLYVAEYGDYDRIQKFAPDGTFLLEWGGHGSEPGQFIRPQNMAVDENDWIWVVDACNDRVQVFDATGSAAKLVKIWGERGQGRGQLRYPYDLVLARDGHVYICEFGNHRVQKFTRDGVSVGIWGTRGRGAGELFNPWAIVQDQRGRIHVLDTYNHRVQRVHF
jgi:DNA-binding beta-propeller fold protein YncE